MILKNLFCDEVSCSKGVYAIKQIFLATLNPFTANRKKNLFAQRKKNRVLYEKHFLVI